MKFLKTFLLLLITAIMAISKTGYAASFAVSSLSADQVEEEMSSDELSNHLSFKANHHAIDNPLIEMDELEDESEDKDSKKRSNQLNAATASVETSHDFTPHCLGCTSSFKGISQTQSIRLHLIIEKLQI